MIKKRDLLIVLISANFITVLFYKQSLGLNLFIFESILFSWVISSRQFHFRSLYSITLGLGLIITTFSTIITFSIFSYIIHFLIFFIFIGLLIFPETKSLIIALGLSLANIFNSQFQFLKCLFDSKLNNQKLGSYIKKFTIFIIPIFIIIFFIIIYRSSNPVFDRLLVRASVFLYDKFSFVLIDFDFMIVITFLVGLFFSIFIFIRTTNHALILIDSNSHEDLNRRRNIGLIKFQLNSLKNEFRAGVFLFIVLNLVLLVLNVIDVKWVWFSFEWEGQYLKQFVHEGTYLLIFSIILSITLVLYYFRGNLNFYTKNKILKYLCYFWLAQNGILSVSVAIRNFWYINYFSLAYKRIGVIIFLIMTIYGLYTVFVKVQKRKSPFYLFKTNSYAMLLVLTISSCIDWDTVIAKYNFKNSSKSFLHLDYLATLSDKSLPYLDKTLSQLKQIEFIQKEKFPFEQKFMSSSEYKCTIENRKKLFKAKWESKGILSWNLAEYLAYHKLCLD